MNKCILVIGATSTIAKECLRIWAEKKAHIYIVARSIEKLTTLKFDLIQRGAISVHIFELDLNNKSGYDKMLESAIRQLKIIDIVLIAHGILPDQKKAKDDADLIYEVFKINSLSVILIITKLLKQFEKQRFGSIGIISSVAGDRIRASNYIYGTTKATVSLFCDGLRVELKKIGVSLTDIKPGYVKSNMTKNLSLPSFLVANPKDVAKNIISGIENKIDVLYTPFFWKHIMYILKKIPGFIFRGLNL